jgi:hypothetical protein
LCGKARKMFNTPLLNYIYIFARLIWISSYYEVLQESFRTKVLYKVLSYMPGLKAGLNQFSSWLGFSPDKYILNMTEVFFLLFCKNYIVLLHYEEAPFLFVFLSLPSCRMFH